MRRVLVRWVDSSGAGGCWEDAETLRTTAALILCETLGFVFEENDEHIVLVQSFGKSKLSEEAQFLNSVCIPKTSIKSTIALALTEGG